MCAVSTDMVAPLQDSAPDEHALSKEEFLHQEASGTPGFISPELWSTNPID